MKVASILVTGIQVLAGLEMDITHLRTHHMSRPQLSVLRLKWISMVDTKQKFLKD